MKTLSQHNEEVGTAGVACDKCHAGMNYDREGQRQEKSRNQQCWPPMVMDGDPVVCPKCGHRGRKLSRIY